METIVLALSMMMSLNFNANIENSSSTPAPAATETQNVLDILQKESEKEIITFAVDLSELVRNKVLGTIQNSVNE